MHKLLIICGPTATGKTALAARLAKKFNGELVSADSRQVYKFMDIGTGKDWPEGIKIWGYDLVNPDGEFSVSEFVKFAEKKINNIYKRGKLPILVGGTGFYIKAIVDDLDRIHIPRNLKLRKELLNKTARELYALLLEKFPKEATKLNASDKANPRRLTRLLEVLNTDILPHKTGKPRFDDVLWLGLMASKDELAMRIENRVENRARNGMQAEVQSLIKKGYTDALAKTIGYKDWPDLDKWKTEEVKYAKRQMTWFKKEPRINWFDVSNSNFEQRIEKLVKKWHNK